MVDLNKNFLTLNTSLLDRLLDDDLVYGYNYNRIVDALNGNYIGVTYIAHNDTWVNTENIDPVNGFNGRLWYVIPSNMVAIQKAFLSIKFLNYRTYSTITFGTTGTDATATTPAADATGESGHSHNHNHSLLPTGNTAGAGTVAWNNGSPGILVVTNLAPNADTSSIQSNAAGSSGHSHNHTHGAHSHSHSHTISGSTIVGIQEDASPSNVTILFDGVDRTVTLGGPFNTDIVELDITSFINQAKSAWHKIEFGGSSRGQLQMHLRLNLLVSTSV